MKEVQSLSSMDAIETIYDCIPFSGITVALLFVMVAFSEAKLQAHLRRRKDSQVFQEFDPEKQE
jgi:hypothetical protein